MTVLWLICPGQLLCVRCRKERAPRWVNKERAWKNSIPGLLAKEIARTCGSRAFVGIWLCTLVEAVLLRAAGPHYLKEMMDQITAGPTGQEKAEYFIQMVFHSSYALTSYLKFTHCGSAMESCWGMMWICSALANEQQKLHIFPSVDGMCKFYLCELQLKFLLSQGGRELRTENWLSAGGR